MLRLILAILLTTKTKKWATPLPLISWITIYLASLVTITNLHPISSNTIFLDPTRVRLARITLWITILVILRRWTTKNKHNKRSKFFSTCLVLNGLITLTFCVRTVITFYILFEITLFPILILIIMWGYQPERLKAVIFIAIYMIVTSLPLLLCIITVINPNAKFLPTLTIKKTFSYQAIFLILAFLAKLPIYLLHLWLPKAHTEAPVAGSIVLARVILKLGRYGILRIVLTLPTIFTSIKHFITPITLLGASITTWLCLRQHDLKETIAYASVRHIRLIASTVATKTQWATVAIILINISHGLTRSLLFSSANTIYENSASRAIASNKGLSSLTPLLVFYLLIALLANGGAPPFANLLREIIIFISLIKKTILTIFPLILMSFISMVYSIFIYINIFHGSPLKSINTINKISPHYLSSHLHLLIILPSLLLTQHISPT